MTGRVKNINVRESLSLLEDLIEKVDAEIKLRILKTMRLFVGVQKEISALSSQYISLCCGPYHSTCCLEQLIVHLCSPWEKASIWEAIVVRTGGRKQCPPFFGHCHLHNASQPPHFSGIMCSIKTTDIMTVLKPLASCVTTSDGTFQWCSKTKCWWPKLEGVQPPRNCSLYYIS